MRYFGLNTDEEKIASEHFRPVRVRNNQTVGAATGDIFQTAGYERN
jgi:hypothetical protein